MRRQFTIVTSRLFILSIIINLNMTLNFTISNFPDMIVCLLTRAVDVCCLPVRMCVIFSPDTFLTLITL